LQLLERRIVYLIPPHTLLEDVKRIFKGSSIDIEEVKVEKSSWQIIGTKDGALIKAALSFTIKRINELMIFGDIPVSELEVYSEGNESLNRNLKRRMEIGLLRAAGV